MMMIAKSKK